MEFNDNYPSYETMYHHTDEEGKVKRRKLWNVFWIMLGITLVELFVGFNATKWGLTGGAVLKWGFIILTLAKAGFIVIEFMHLGHETKFFKYTILLPYAIFIAYLIFIILVEGTYCGYTENKPKLNPIFMDQKIENNAKHGRQYINDAHGLKLSTGESPKAEELHHEGAEH
jgi:cytochrome c oxidase subunit IV